MSFTVDVQASSAFVMLDNLADDVRERFAASVENIEQTILAEAQRNAVAHFHSVGKKPGRYLAAFRGGVKQTESAVIGWVGNSSPLAHLLENGFTISDLMISAGSVMKFELDGVADLYRREVHRHSTAVQAYPALTPAFNAHKGEVESAARQAVENL